MSFFFFFFEETVILIKTHTKNSNTSVLNWVYNILHNHSTTTKRGSTWNPIVIIAHTFAILKCKQKSPYALLVLNCI